MAAMHTSNVRDERVNTAGGLTLFVRSWRPDKPPRAVVLIVHGFNSHVGYYGWTAEQLVAAGFAVYAVDLRGRGRSDGERFYVQRLADYVSDVRMLATLARARELGLPVFLYGHSAGGVVSCIYALEHQAELAGLVCASFAFEMPAPDFALAVLKGLSHVAPHAHVLKLKNEDFSRDLGVVAAMNEDPLIADETQPTNTVAEMVRADERLKRDFPLLHLPVLILHGTHDRATRPTGSRRFFAEAGSADKTLKLYEGAFHDLLNDLGKQGVMADVKEWLEQRLPGN
jgi:alpha-beta hydrolase superfamily lysophospholipase